MNHFISTHPIGFAFLVVGACLLLGVTRNTLTEAIAALLNFVASPLVASCRAIQRFLPHVSDWIDRGLRALTVSDRSGEQAEPNWAGWDLIMPLLWLGLFLILVVSDLYVADLRLAALLGVRPYLASVRLPVDLFLAVMLVSVTASFAFALPELRKSTLARRPWASLNDEDRQRLMMLCAIGLGLTFAAALVLWFWGALQRGNQAGLGELEGGLAWLFWLLLALPLLGATALAGWAALASGAAVLVICLMVLRGALHLVDALFRVVIWVLDKFAELLTKLIDLPAHLGAGTLNAVASHLPVGWRFEIKFIERPRIGSELDEQPAAQTDVPPTQPPAPGASSPPSSGGPPAQRPGTLSPPITAEPTGREDGAATPNMPPGAQPVPATDRRPHPASAGSDGNGASSESEPLAREAGRVGVPLRTIRPRRYRKIGHA